MSETSSAYQDASRDHEPTIGSALEGGTSHTPGPWSVCGADRGGCKCNVIMSEHHPIATYERGDWGNSYASLRLTGGSLDGGVEAYMEFDVFGEVPEEVALANAHLIAAAPQLLEALRAVQRAWGNETEESAAMRLADIAIAAALGPQVVGESSREELKTGERTS